MDWDYKKHTKEYIDKISKVYEDPVTRATLEIILTLLTISFFTFFAIRPTLKTIADLQNTIKSKQEVKEKLTEKIAYLKEAEENYDAIAADLIYLEQALPSQVEFIPALKRIAVLASEENVILEKGNSDNFTLIESTEDSKLEKIGFNLSVIGEYPNIINFLEKLENLRRFYKLDQFTFTTKKTDSEDGLNMEFNGYIYWQKNEEK